MRQSGTHEQHPVPVTAGRRCQLLTCASGTAEMARRPLLARTRALLGRHDSGLSASWLASPCAAFRLPRGRQQACRFQPGSVTAVTGTRDSARSEGRGYTLNEDFRLPESDREEYRARVAERKSRAEKVLPGSVEAEAMMLLLKSGLPAYVKDAVLMAGLAAYLDFTDIAAKAGYTRNWEATEVPMEHFFKEGMSEHDIQVARARWFSSLCKFPLSPPRGESRSKKKAEVKAEVPSKGFGGAAAAKGFGGGEAKPSRGRKKKGAASAAKKIVKSQNELLYEVEMKAKARELEREQEEWSQYMAWVESTFGPMTDTTLAVFLSHKAFWDIADNLFLLAVTPFLASAFMGCSMEYCVRLLRSLRFAYVVSTPMRLRDASEASETPKEEKMSQGQGLLSGVGTALRDALSFRKGAAAASDATERDVTLEEMRQMSQEESDQRLLASLEVEDKLGEEAESTEATPVRRYQMIEALLAPGFKWWADRPVRLQKLANAGKSKAAPSLPVTAFPEDALLGGASMPESPAADVNGFDSRGAVESSSFAPSPVDDESAELSGQSLEAAQASEDIEEQSLVSLEQLIESEEFQQSAGSSEQSTEALQASMEALEQAAEQLQTTLEQPLEASQTQPESSQLPLDASQQPYKASAPSFEASETASEPVDQSLDSSTVPAPPEQSLEAAQQQVEQSRAALQASEQALEALEQSSAASQRSLEALDQPPLEAASAEASMQMPETLQQAEADDSNLSVAADRQADSAEPAESVQQAREASAQLRDASEQEPKLVEESAEDRQRSAGQPSKGSLEASTVERSAPPASPPSQPQPLRQLADRFNDTAEELAQLDASAMGPRARRPPAARTKNTRSRDGWTSLPEQAPETRPERQPERQPAFATAPAVRAPSAPSAPWQPRVRVQPPAYQGAYIAPQLLPGDRRDWKAAGVLAYTVDEVGVHLLLGRIDQRSPYAPARPREDGWWILGGKRSGADYSAEATAVREMFEETAGVLSGRDVSGGQLSEVLWYPEGGYALFPLYIPGKPDIPRAYTQRLLERERIRRRAVRRVAGPRPMSKLGWVPLNTIIERRCKLHLVLNAMLYSTPLVSYLQQMQQLLSQQAAFQANPMTHPLGSPYGGPVPVVPRAVQAPALARVGDGSSSYSRVRPPSWQGPSAGSWTGAAIEQRSMSSPTRVHPSDSFKPMAPPADSYPTAVSAAPANGSAAAGRRPPSASAAAESAAPAHSSAPDQRRPPARLQSPGLSAALAAPAEPSSATPSADSANGSAADKRRSPTAAPATEIGAPASGSSRRRDNSRAAQAVPAGFEAISASKEGVSSRGLAEQAARAADSEEVMDTAPEAREAQREVPPWERELHAPKPYKPAIIRRGRRRVKRRVT